MPASDTLSRIIGTSAQGAAVARSSTPAPQPEPQEPQPTPAELARRAQAVRRMNFDSDMRRSHADELAGTHGQRGLADLGLSPAKPAKATPAPAQKNILQTLADEARVAPAGVVSYDGNGDVKHILPKPPASIRHLRLAEVLVPVSHVGRAAGTEVFNPFKSIAAGQTLDLQAALMKYSKVAQAGATIMVCDDVEQNPSGPVQAIGWTEVPAAYVNLEPARFAHMAQGAQVAASAKPWGRAVVDWNAAPQWAVRFELSRAESKQLGEGFVSEAVLVAITMGLANLADQVLLQAIAAANRPAFTLAAAAARGLNFAELRSLVGTSGTGAAVGQDGTLRAAGVLAELSNAAAGTVVGAFNRSAVAVRDEIHLLAQRTNLRGATEWTCWISASALLPDTSAFWSVA